MYCSLSRKRTFSYSPQRHFFITLMFLRAAKYSSSCFLKFCLEIVREALNCTFGSLAFVLTLPVSYLRPPRYGGLLIYRIAQNEDATSRTKHSCPLLSEIFPSSASAHFQNDHAAASHHLSPYCFLDHSSRPRCEYASDS